MSNSAPALKQLGNVAFKIGDWKKASDYYTQALALKPYGDEAAVLYSNRSSCNLHLSRLDFALLDASAAVQLKPDWSKGYARKAEAQAYLQAFNEATKAYLEAAQHAEDEPTRARLEAAAKLMKKKLDGATQAGSDHFHATAMRTDNPTTWITRSKAQKNSGKPFPKFSLVELAMWSFVNCEKAHELLDRSVKIGPGGRITASIDSPSIHFAKSILYETKGMHLKVPEVPTDSPLAKIQAQAQHDNRAHGYESYGYPNAPLQEVIDRMDAKRIESGWDSIRPVIQSLVSNNILIGYSFVANASIGDGVERFKRAMTLVDLGFKKWKPQAGDEADTCGEVFSTLFRRGLKVLVLCYVEQGYLGARSATARRAFPLTELQKLSQEILDDCAANPIPQEGVEYTAFQLLAQAYAWRSLSLVQSYHSVDKTRRKKHGKAYYPDLEPSRLGSEYCFKAAEFFPDDSQDKSICYYRSLSMGLRAGGLTVEEVLERAGEAEASMAGPEAIFGPPPRDLDDRRFSRLIIKQIRDWLDSPEASNHGIKDKGGALITDSMQITLKPVPSLWRKDLKKNEKSLASVDQKILDLMTGDLQFVDIIDADPKDFVGFFATD